MESYDGGQDPAKIQTENGRNRSGKSLQPHPGGWNSDCNSSGSALKKSNREALQGEHLVTQK